MMINTWTKTTLSAALLSVAALLLLLGSIPILNLSLLPLFVGMLFGITSKRLSKTHIKILLWFTAVITGLFIAIYRPSGFNYPTMLHDILLYEDGTPFTLRLNTCKAIGGYLVIIWLLDCTRRQTQQQSWMPSLVVAGTGILVVVALANIVFDVSWRPKFPRETFHFIAVNLLVTVVAEEAFFRLLIQVQLSNFFAHKPWGKWLALIVTSLLFALSHSTQLGSAFILFFIAGTIYSFVYMYTKRLEIAIAVHFGVNITHFLLLDYPLSI